MKGHFPPLDHYMWCSDHSSSEDLEDLPIPVVLYQHNRVMNSNSKYLPSKYENENRQIDTNNDMSAEDSDPRVQKADPLEA